MIYHLDNSRISIFDSNEDLREIGIYSENLYTELQLVKFGLEIVKRTTDLGKGLDIYYNIPLP